jgi:hypothetical protein
VTIYDEIHLMKYLLTLTLTLIITLLLTSLTSLRADEKLPQPIASIIERNCFDCHNAETKEGKLDLTAMTFDLANPKGMERWVQIFDRVEKREMPPDTEAMTSDDRKALLASLESPVHAAGSAATARNGRGPMRRLNRMEFEQNLRDLLALPFLDIRDMLPADRESQHIDKVSSTLDMSHVQLTAYLDALETALRQAMVATPAPPEVKKTRVFGKLLGPRRTTGGVQSLFYARDGKGFDLKETNADTDKDAVPDPDIEFALFRSPGWPYAVYPKKIIANATGEYRVRFSARSVLQIEGFELKKGTSSVPMNFRARKPTNHDIAEDVRVTGGIIDVQPEGGVYETTVYLFAGQTIEYGMLGLPVPQIDALGRTGFYRYPPLPEGGQPGIAFQWLEMEGPIAPASWPPASHRVLFDDLGVEVKSTKPADDAKRLLRRFIALAAREPVPEEAIPPFDKLVLDALQNGETLAEALLAGYQSFLCSGLFLYLREPIVADDHFAIANRLSHFLTDSRPDAELSALAQQKKLRDPATLRAQTDRLISSAGFERFVNHFTDCWLNLRELRRDDPDIRLYPEYRLDDYLVESMGQETRAFFTAMLRENLPATSIIESDFAFVNDRLARHYGLPEVNGAALQRMDLPNDSPYGGLITQGSILKVSANGTSTSPVLRGVWIMDRLIGDPPPPPPPGIPAVEPDIRGATTIRELIAQHTKSKTCSACHAKFDPVGLALENFDIHGAWRTRYRGTSDGQRITGIDRAGHDFAFTLASKVDASGQLADGRKFENIHDMKAILSANSRQLARNLLHQFTLYATGTPVQFSDRREIEAMLDACARDGYRVRDLVHALVQSSIFPGNPKP